MNVDLFSPDRQKVGIFLTKFSLKNLVVKFVVINFAAYSMTYTFTGSLASDDKKTSETPSGGDCINATF